MISMVDGPFLFANYREPFQFGTRIEHRDFVVLRRSSLSADIALKKIAAMYIMWALWNRTVVARYG